MQKKAIALKNLGMNRDMSISKIGETNAYENYNIRILARENDTLLSVTNERGNVEISLTGDNGISGDYLIGWNVLNDYLILFLTSDSGNDYIYRVDFSTQTPVSKLLFPTASNILANDNSLNFDAQHPIESIVYYESDSVQKVYWVDGINPLRMMNFVADDDEMAKWDSTYFDANRELKFNASVAISKDNSGNPRPNGTIQYLLTYFNKHGQETGYAWMSDIIYLSPVDSGGAADETNSNRIKLTLSGLDTRFTHFRIYSVFRSSYDGTPVAYIVGDGLIDGSGKSVIVDDAANQVAVDASSLLFLGSQPVVPGTMAHKDETLFLGDLNYTGRNYDAIEDAIATYMRDSSGNCTCITFEHEDGEGYVNEDGLYPYKNQLVSDASQITTFKGNEKYRFALSFRTKHGKQTEAFWIGDAINEKYPIIDKTNGVVKRIVAKCDVPPEVIGILKDPAYDFDLSVMQLMIAEASYADRSVKAQGVINPTVFNVWSRYNDRIYAAPSWMTRPRNSVSANRHFEVIHNSTNSTGEIECNHWDTKDTPKPYYQYKNYLANNQGYTYDYEGIPESDYSMLIIRLSCSQHTLVTGFTFEAYAYYVTSRTDDGRRSDLEGFLFSSSGHNIFPSGSFGDTNNNGSYSLKSTSVIYSWCGATYDEACNAVYVGLKDLVLNSLHVPERMFVSERSFKNLCNATGKGDDHYVNCKYFDDLSNSMKTTDVAAADYSSGNIADRWTTDPSGFSSNKGAYVPSYYTQHLMFVDENVLTLNSPEVFFGDTSLDNVSGCKLRIVGAAKITSNITDYTVDASNAMLPGRNLANVNFSGTKDDGLIKGLQSWPLWDEYSLLRKTEEEDPGITEKLMTDLTSADYSKGPGNFVRYWLYMWDNAGAIDNYADENNFSYGVMRHKVFANLKFAYSTVYNSVRANDWKRDLMSVRTFKDLSSQVMSLNVGGKSISYDGCIDELLSMPGTLKYPIIYSTKAPEANQIAESTLAYMYSNTPVPVTYDTNPHLVLSLPSEVTTDSDEMNIFKQTILPRLQNEDDVVIPRRDEDNRISGALLPWWDSENGNQSSSQSGRQHSGAINVVDGMSLPNAFTLESYSEAGGHASLTLNDTSANIASLISIWETCMSYVGADDLYVRIPVSCGWSPIYDNKIFLVNIAYYAQIDSENIMLPYSDVSGYDYSGGTTVTRNVNFVEYDNGTLDAKGYQVFTIGTGDYDDVPGYPYLDYAVDSTVFNLTPYTGSDTVGPKDEYVFIGEIYYPFGEDGIEDTRYGDVKNNRFVIAGPQYNIKDMSSTSGSHNYVYANHGDTYFQRWDDLRVKPHSEDDVNSVVDIVSVMLETHINIDGRTDNNRGTKYIASMNNVQFDSINRAYSQPNNFAVQRDLDSDFNLDSYGSYVTWTLQKAAMAETDEWMHLTLANSLALDGDKGICRAIRRFQNSLISFQDRCISEILFNSRTQIPTSEGVPIEIANSGKVDGKRIISNKFGCINKWSIIEGKSALYFIDNINKAFCGFDGNAVSNLSSRFGFDVVFRETNSVDVWNPKTWPNTVSFYDRIHSDVYLVNDYPTIHEENNGTLVYNENLGRFSTFLGYSHVPMMTNITDGFISFKKNQSGINRLWWQNRGFYCNFFGVQEDFSVCYNVTPDPYGDKIWTNLEYRADFYEHLGNDLSANFEDYILDGGDNATRETYYRKDKTFDKLFAWDEYQRTPVFTADESVKKFRIWRTQIPRAIVTSTNKYGFDRIRNPWIKLFMGRNMVGDDKKDLVQLHDVNVIYYE